MHDRCSDIYISSPILSSPLWAQNSMSHERYLPYEYKHHQQALMFQLIPEGTWDTIVSFKEGRKAILH